MVVGDFLIYSNFLIMANAKKTSSASLHRLTLLAALETLEESVRLSDAGNDYVKSETAVLVKSTILRARMRRFRSFAALPRDDQMSIFDAK